MYKFSNYNIRIPISDNSDILYNASTDKFIAIRNNVKLDNVSDLSSNLFELLHDNGMIVSWDTNERERVISDWHKYARNNNVFTLMINPTLKCNFNCWYCYENHKDAKTMDDSTLEKLKQIIDSKIGYVKRLLVSFFGGEPLMEFSRIVKPLIEYAELKSHGTETDVHISFTTNGFLINQEMIDFFADHNVNFMQITLDGGRISHNKTRVSHKKDSFETITDNIRKLLEKEITVTLRINITPSNINECDDIENWIMTLPKELKKCLYVNVQQVWQTKDQDISSQIDNLMDSICDLGVYAYPALYDNMRRMCYSDKFNTMLVNSDGKIFKCSALDFTSEAGISHIDSISIDKDLENEFEYLQKKRFSNVKCESCKIFPLCLGGCSKTISANDKNSYCVYGDSDERKDDLVMTIIKDRIRKDNMIESHYKS